MDAAENKQASSVVHEGGLGRFESARKYHTDDTTTLNDELDQYHTQRRTHHGAVRSEITSLSIEGTRSKEISHTSGASSYRKSIVASCFVGVKDGVLRPKLAVFE